MWLQNKSIAYLYPFLHMRSENSTFKGLSTFLYNTIQNKSMYLYALGLFSKKERQNYLSSLF